MFNKSWNPFLSQTFYLTLEINIESSFIFLLTLIKVLVIRNVKEYNFFLMLTLSFIKYDLKGHCFILKFHSYGQLLSLF